MADDTVECATSHTQLPHALCAPKIVSRRFTEHACTCAMISTSTGVCVAAAVLTTALATTPPKPRTRDSSFSGRSAVIARRQARASSTEFFFWCAALTMSCALTAAAVELACVARRAPLLRNAARQQLVHGEADLLHRALLF